MIADRSTKSKPLDATKERKGEIERSPEKTAKVRRGHGGGKTRIRARVTEFAYPPVHDGVVIGKTAQLGLAAFRKALDLLVSVPFVHVHVDDDDIVGDILIRHAILRRIDKPKLLAFVMRRIKPLMSSEEILHLDLHIEIELDAES
jgi:hypothetical protein